ncbi:hypothetical protein EIN_180820 [Entamoeba invadens IP1]|uniref:hypothetical protein n=1 Tax=Entamoeba invadens IP1 TaxID=370355 RepID=UPI0002C3ECB8|nr:hypothetical protein EIN_180820 [Entamoeba invadens IP1]ELP93955.1 hypothetical protein EIN_180820 [Entamoeba invadens IP1]|eukprot:XP_004260726.1 hypothetical protein EIN_180820 [Entamoeba invadens IP1]
MDKKEMSTLTTQSTVTTGLSRDRKRASRSCESCVTNAIVYTLISQMGATATFRKTKKSKQTVKMYLPETVSLNGTIYDQNTLASMSETLLTQVLGEAPMDISAMNDKQYNRSKEAQVNNGILYLLNTLGYTFAVKQTKRTKCTERLVKINSLTTPFADVISGDLLEEAGVAFGKKIEELFGREMTISVSAENLNDLPQLPFSFNQTNLYQQVVEQSNPCDGSMIGSIVSDGNSYYFVTQDGTAYNFNYTM